MHTNTDRDSVWADVGYATPSSGADGAADYWPLMCLLVISLSVIFVVIIM